MILRAIIIFIFLGFYFSSFSEKPYLRYAKGFQVRVVNGVKILTVGQLGEPAESPHSYLLVPRGTHVSFAIGTAQVIETPIRSVASLSGTQVSHLLKLGLGRRLRAFSDLRQLKNSKLRERAEQGKILEMGSEVNSVERLCFEEGIDLLMDLGLGNPSDRFNSLIGVDIGVTKFRDYLEPHPLGAAEWIKFTALFFDREELAEQIFSVVESRYQRLKRRTQKCRFRPTVLLNSLYQGRWHLPGAESFWGQILQAAGGSYVFENARGHSIHELVFDQVLSLAQKANFWIAPETDNQVELLQRNIRHAEFLAFEGKRIFGGLKNHWDLLRTQPDLLLKDVISVLHPELTPGHQPVYLKGI
jgi:iron complex transport system substrate-binding protein